MIIVLSSPNAGLDVFARGLGATLVEVEVTEMRAVRAVVERHRPSAVVSTVWRDARRAETHPEQAFRYGGEAAINLAAAALEFESAACLLSVADVFGQGGGPFDESATPVPGSEYAEAARRAEVFFSRATRDQGLIVRSGPWRETLAEAVGRRDPVPAGARLQVVAAEALGRFVAARLAAGERGVVHAVPAEAVRPAAELFAEIARERGGTVGDPDLDSPFAPAAVLTSRHHAPMEPAPVPPREDVPPVREPSTLLARHDDIEWSRYTGSPGQTIEVETRGRRVSLWLRTGKGLVEREGAEDRLLGPEKTLTLDGSNAVRFAPATDFELFVLSTPSPPR